MNVVGDVMTGPLTVPDLVISGEGPEPGLVWTSEDTLGSGAWQEPSSLVVAETSDPVLINWFDQSAEGWVQYSGGGLLTFTEMNSPSMPGVLYCTDDVWAEWQYGEPMVYEPEAQYRITVRARMDATASLSFGLQCYDALPTPTVVDAANGSDPLNPHWCAVGLIAGDSAWEDDVLKPGEWLAWTGYVSGRTDGVAENIPAAGEVAPSELAVVAAGGVHQWRPAFHATGGKVWVDAFEVHRLDRSLELPGGVRATDVYAQSVNATTVTTENLVIPPSTTGYLLTATTDAGDSDWLPMPVTVSEGPPTEAPDNPLTINLGTVYERYSCLVYAQSSSITITSTVNTARVPGSKAVQFSLTTPAMVAARASFFLQQSANSGQILYGGIGAEDENGVFLFADDWAGPGSSVTYGTAYLRSATGGALLVPGAALWKRLLPPGTYMLWPRSWIQATDAASNKSIGVYTMDIEIDPGMKYLPGQRP